MPRDPTVNNIKYTTPPNPLSRNRIPTMKLKNIEFTINTTAGPLREYTDPDAIPDTPGEAIRYIQAQAGESFSFHIYIPIGDDGIRPPANSLDCRIYFNGNRELNRILELGESIVLSSSTVRPAAGGGWIEREFLFDKLTVTEDPDMIGVFGNKKRKLEELGEIKVVWYRFNQTGVSESSLGEKAVDVVKVVHETELKGRDIEHSVGCASTPRCVVILLS